ncbi:hypothetical protein Emin_0191 [Elusimicrobium minutum Pei191]|uniref:Lipoprotein n=1 Tax=Elusimicrobium minutum (strain Pei191) TaxID=445932 RepID=B2KBR8_ELUMP|nr:hypothetical protein [Elusimicrobium minutum]ACC97755.1 hypothetical protein Emin_0191 [Elusimicrobium minutum Pei191]
MKKILALTVCAVILAACSTVNKNTLSYKLSKVSSEKYITGVGFAQDKKEAQERAKADIQAFFNATSAGQMPVVADIYNHAFIEETWKDKQTNTYYAIAALERKVAKNMIKNNLDAMDSQLAGLVMQFNMKQDKFAKVKTALKIQPLLLKRNALEDLHEKIDYTGQGYDPQNFSSLKNIVYQSMNDVRFSLQVLGKNSEILHTHIINALNEMGLSVAINQEADISVDVNSEIVEYPSKRLEGLYWCSATATVGLKDVETGGIFARFSISGRQGSSRTEEAVKRTMDDIGQSAGKEIKDRLYDYLERR